MKLLSFYKKNKIIKKKKRNNKINFLKFLLTELTALN